jgi:thiol:disulfide interchange protein DsbD
MLKKLQCQRKFADNLYLRSGLSVFYSFNFIIFCEMLRHHYLFVLLFLTTTFAWAQQDKVKWTFEAKSLGGEDYELTFRAAIQEGWYTYSMYMAEGGPVPTSITYDSKHQKLQGKAIEATSKPDNKKTGFDPLFDMDVIKYKKDLIYTQKIKVAAADAAKPIVGYVNCMACDHERCLPPTDSDFEIKLPAAVVAKEATKTAEPATIEPAKDTVKGGNNLDPSPNTSGRDTASATSGSVDPRSAEVYNPVNEKIQSSLKAVIEQGSCSNLDNIKSVTGLGWIFLFGFLGGLFALLTPCVFPMVPLTVSYFTKRKNKNGFRDALIYAASIIVIYVGLGLLITIVFGESALNWLSTHWVPNLLFFILFVAFAISFFGYYDIKLPSSWSNKTDQAADKGGLLGIFFMAFTLSLVSFSCTGPIIGTLLVEAAEGGRIAPATGMFGFALALALPFGLFSAFPAWLNSLPKSGGWMNTIKVVLGFVELALAFKFLSKADLTEHWGILKYETFMVAVLLCAVGLGLYLFGFIRFPHDDKEQKISLVRKVSAVLTLALAGYLSTGFMAHPITKTYWTPDILSGIAPPACYSYARPCKCPAGIETCFKDYYEGLAYAKKMNKPILLDFTGHGCENCRKMEDQIWVKDRVNKLLKDEYVLISLYVDDRTDLPKVLKTSEGRKLRTTGSLWATFESVNFNETSQPLYVPMSPDEEVLNVPTGALFDEVKYAEFLECALKRYKDKQK